MVGQPSCAKRKDHSSSTCISTELPLSHRQIGFIDSTASVAEFSRLVTRVPKIRCFVPSNNSLRSRGPPLPIDDDGAIVHALTFTVSSEGALDFVEELQVRESDWEVADKHARVNDV